MRRVRHLWLGCEGEGECGMVEFWHFHWIGYLVSRQVDRQLVDS